MPAFHLTQCRHFMLIMVLVTALAAGMSARAAAGTQRVVVIDPGHGGSDAGVGGLAGTTENHLTLDIAERIANHLRSRYHVVLTRTSDVGVTIDERSGRANHQKGAAFISIHAGGSMNRIAEGITIFYYTGIHIGGPEPAPGSYGDSQPWNRVQTLHRAASSALAHRIKARLEAPPNTAPVVITDAPVRVLKGVDMPAVAVEVGYLSNPLEEKRLMDATHLAALSMRISQGIDDYFNVIDTISTSDITQ